MPRKKTKTKKTTHKPLVISIHGDGIDIEATFRDSGPSRGWADFMKRAVAPMPGFIASPPEGTASDLEAVQRVITHGPVHTVQAVMELASAELEQRRAVEASDTGESLVNGESHAS